MFFFCVKFRGGGGGSGVRMGRGFGRGSGLVGWSGGGQVGGQGGYGRRMEVFVKIQKQDFEGGVGIGSGRVGVRVDVNQELKFL